MVATTYLLYVSYDPFRKRVIALSLKRNIIIQKTSMKRNLRHNERKLHIVKHLKVHIQRLRNDS